MVCASFTGYWHPELPGDRGQRHRTDNGGTNSAEDHKRCCAVVEAFRQVGQEASSQTECRPFLRIAALSPGYV